MCTTDQSPPSETPGRAQLSCYLLLVVRPGATSSVLAPSSFLLLLVRHLLLLAWHLFLVVMPGATRSVLAPSSDALVPSSVLDPSMLHDLGGWRVPPIERSEKGSHSIKT